MLRKVLFRFTKDSKYLKSYSDKFHGERCFIIGNGPSLCMQDLDAIQNEYSFGVNSIFKAYPYTKWRPTFYMAADDKFFKYNKDYLHDLVEEKRTTVFFSYYGKKYINTSNVHFFFHNYLYRVLDAESFRKDDYSMDVSKYFSQTLTVVCMCIEFAIYMGFNKIYLVGIDNTGPSQNEHQHFYKENNNEIKTYTFYDEAVNSCYRAMKELAREKHVDIFNATRGGKLEVFERVEIGSLFGNN